MKPSVRLRLTQGLVLLSLLMSGLSYIAKTTYGVSLYPFSHWKLFTQPKGNRGFDTVYQLYGVTNESDTVQIKNKGFEHYTKDDFYYIINKEANDVLTNSADAIEDIHTFGQEIALEFDFYVLKEVTIKPFELYNKQQIEESTIILTTNNAP